MCNTMLQQLHEMPNLSHTCSTLGMDQFIELFEWYLEFKDYWSNPETYTMAVFWNSYLEMVQTLHDFVKPVKTGYWDLHVDASASEKMLH